MFKVGGSMGATKRKKEKKKFPVKYIYEQEFVLD